MQKSIGRWFKSGSKEIFFSNRSCHALKNSYLVKCQSWFAFTPFELFLAVYYNGKKQQVRKNKLLPHQILGSIVVSIPACHAGDRGSIPRRGGFLFQIVLLFDLEDFTCPSIASHFNSGSQLETLTFKTAMRCRVLSCNSWRTVAKASLVQW